MVLVGRAVLAPGAVFCCASVAASSHRSEAGSADATEWMRGIPELGLGVLKRSELGLFDAGKSLRRSQDPSSNQWWACWKSVWPGN